MRLTGSGTATSLKGDGEVKEGVRLEGAAFVAVEVLKTDGGRTDVAGEPGGIRDVVGDGAGGVREARAVGVYQ